MKLSQVTLAADMRRPQNTNDMTRAFRAADGYSLEVTNGMLVVEHSGKRRVVSATWIVDAEPLEQPAPAPAPAGKGK